MRIILTVLFVILGANFMIELLDSNMSEILNDRRETIERFSNWSPLKCSSITAKQFPLMQLTSQGQHRAMVVEFRPHNILTDKFVYTHKFMGDEMTKSMRLMSKKEMIETVNARLDLNYEVTDFLTEPQEYFPACC